MSTTALLDRPALVLNRAWSPIQVTSAREAIGLVARGSALIIEPDTFETHDLSTWNDVSRPGSAGSRGGSAPRGSPSFRPK